MDKIRPTCPDCGVAVSEAHVSGCDVARCLATGGQRFGCGGELHEFKGTWYGEHDGECGDDEWTGYWPGDLDAARLGFWSRWVDLVTGTPVDFREPGRWQSCGPGDEGARPDLNRLHPPYAYWSTETLRWEAP